MNKIIIAPLSLHDIISKNLLSSDDLITNTSLMPLSSFISETVKTETNDYDKLLQERLIEIQSNLKVLSDYVDNLNFIKSLKEFHIDMHLYDIQLTDLNSASSKDQDLKYILSEINDLIPYEIIQFNALKEYAKSNDFSHVFIAKDDSTSNYINEVVNFLLNNKAQLYKEKTYNLKQVEVFYANNLRSEVEASAQLIIEKNLKNPLVIMLNEEYREIVKQVYARYNIVNSLDFNNNDNFTNIKFLSILSVLLRQDKKSFKEFISANPFNLKSTTSLSILNDFFNFDLEQFLSYQTFILDDPILNKHDIKYFNQLNENSMEDINYLQSTLSSLINSDEIKTIENTFNFMLEESYDDDLVSISNLLLSNKEALITAKDKLYFLSNLLLSKSSHLINSDHVVVSGLNAHRYFNKENVIILGASIKNFPNISKLSGVIDENYVKNLKYPSKTKRFNTQLQNLDDIKLAENMYIFYPLSSNEGKSIEPSFSLLNFAYDFSNEKQKRYNLVENDYYKKREYKLDPSYAKKLFFNDNILSGSISAFEQYNKCNYAYYLKYGLKIFPKSLPSLSHAYLGSVTHLIIEKIVSSQMSGSSYPSLEEIITIINSAFASLELLNDPKVDIVKLSLIKNFIPVLELLETMDKDTHFKPIALEDSFTYNIKDKILINGYIDRVDKFNDYIRVIDYKSSTRSLDETKLKQGLQLQLITYLMAASQKFTLKPSGAYYTMLRVYPSNNKAFSVYKSNPYIVKSSDETIDSALVNSNRNEGWHFSEMDELYTSNAHFKNLGFKNDLVTISAKKKLNFETVASIVDQVYLNIYDDLSQGIIDCSPVDNPCQFCEYQAICLNGNSANYKKPIFEKQKLDEEIDYVLD